MAKQIKISLNPVESSKLERWAKAQGHKLTTFATHLIRMQIAQAEQRGDIPPEESSLEIDELEALRNDLDTVLSVLAAAAKGDELGSSDISQVARVIQEFGIDVDPHQLHEILQKKKNGNGNPAKSIN